ncbi:MULTISPECIES: hypothetical protein [Methylomonas]|uniref:Uncharacterized protein n=1 Tax=Methylomonas koyamae TaxID=702114 RepID=A0A177NSW9_9GAMM|nr:hypothetical protein [Methylomonas koyamae]OAI21167.1 hypothetical protein A1355_23535 [Methylomonas koyamae]
MPAISETLAKWEQSLCPRVEVSGLVARNHVAHKWKAPFRSLVLRETTFWRINDLLTQSYELHINHRALGARILLRSAFETLAVLIHLNQLTAQVLEGTLSFHTLSRKTTLLLLGSRDKTTRHEAISIVTVLSKHCERTYPGISDLYASLCESAHPNFEGMCFGYSRVDHEAHASEFSNNMCEMYEERHLSAMELCAAVFEHEYNTVWPNLFTRLEAWVEENDGSLEATKE